jgi:hypothetical protein
MYGGGFYGEWFYGGGLLHAGQSMLWAANGNACAFSDDVVGRACSGQPMAMRVRPLTHAWLMYYAQQQRFSHPHGRFERVGWPCAACVQQPLAACAVKLGFSVCWSGSLSPKHPLPSGQSALVFGVAHAASPGAVTTAGHHWFIHQCDGQGCACNALAEFWQLGNEVPRLLP